jgi:hypothetical protein
LIAPARWQPDPLGTVWRKSFRPAISSGSANYADYSGVAFPFIGKFASFRSSFLQDLTRIK